MFNGNRLIVSLMISIGWVVLSIATLLIAMGLASNSLVFVTFIFAILAFLFGVSATYALVGLLAQPPTVMVERSSARRARIDRALRELDDDDLELLRERLSYDDGEYGSLDELLSEKRKHHNY